MVTQCTQFFKLSQDEMQNAFYEKNVQMEIVICCNSRINKVSRYRMLCCGSVSSLYAFFSLLADCFIYLFIIYEKNSLDALQD